MRLTACLSIAAFAVCLPVSAQQHFTLKRVVFHGKTPYTDAELQAASGLKPGQSITTADLTAAAQRLMDTGVMRDVDPSLDGPVTGITAILKVSPVDGKDLLPTAVDNLIWLDPKQVPAELHRRVPLYSPNLPQAGTLAPQVRDALQAMLAEKGISYKVVLTDAPSTDTVPETLHFRIDTPVLVLNTVHLDGLTAETAPALRQSLSGVVGKPYEEGSGEQLHERLLTPFRNTGYLDATITGLSRSAGPEKAGIVGVVISGTVTPGSPYHVGGLTYMGSPLYTSQQFAAAQKLHAGDVASEAALQASYQPILDTYHDQGYVDVRVDTAPQLDRAAHTVNYTLSVVPGQPYTVGAVHTDGLSGQAEADFKNNWKLKAGSVYNASYPRNFLRGNSALLSLHPYTAIYDTKADPATHTIDLNIHFLRNNRN